MSDDISPIQKLRMAIAHSNGVTGTLDLYSLARLALEEESERLAVADQVEGRSDAGRDSDYQGGNTHLSREYSTHGGNLISDLGNSRGVAGEAAQSDLHQIGGETAAPAFHSIDAVMAIAALPAIWNVGSTSLSPLLQTRELLPHQYVPGWTQTPGGSSEDAIGLKQVEAKAQSFSSPDDGSRHDVDFRGNVAVSQSEYEQSAKSDKHSSLSESSPEAKSIYTNRTSSNEAVLEVSHGLQDDHFSPLIPNLNLTIGATNSHNPNSTVPNVIAFNPASMKSNEATSALGLGDSVSSGANDGTGHFGSMVRIDALPVGRSEHLLVPSIKADSSAVTVKPVLVATSPVVEAGLPVAPVTGEAPPSSVPGPGVTPADPLPPGPVVEAGLPVVPVTEEAPPSSVPGPATTPADPLPPGPVVEAGLPVVPVTGEAPPSSVPGPGVTPADPLPPGPVVEAGLPVVPVTEEAPPSSVPGPATTPADPLPPGPVVEAGLPVAPVTGEVPPSSVPGPGVTPADPLPPGPAEPFHIGEGFSTDVEVDSIFVTTSSVIDINDWKAAGTAPDTSEIEYTVPNETNYGPTGPGISPGLAAMLMSGPLSGSQLSETNGLGGLYGKYEHGSALTYPVAEMTEDDSPSEPIQEQIRTSHSPSELPSGMDEAHISMNDGSNAFLGHL